MRVKTCGLNVAGGARSGMIDFDHSTGRVCLGMPVQVCFVLSVHLTTHDVAEHFLSYCFTLFVACN